MRAAVQNALGEPANALRLIDIKDRYQLIPTWRSTISKGTPAARSLRA